MWKVLPSWYTSFSIKQYPLKKRLAWLMDLFPLPAFNLRHTEPGWHTWISIFIFHMIDGFLEGKEIHVHGESNTGKHILKSKMVCKNTRLNQYNRIYFESRSDESNTSNVVFNSSRQLHQLPLLQQLGWVWVWFPHCRVLLAAEAHHRMSKASASFLPLESQPVLRTC